MTECGMTYSQAARQIGWTRNQVAGVIHRHKNPRDGVARDHSYSEGNLTEKWADRKARLLRERGASL